MMSVISLSPTGFKVLRALNTYRFLTVAQMLRLGVGKDPETFVKFWLKWSQPSEIAAALPRPKEIGMLDFGVLPGIGPVVAAVLSGTRWR